MTLLLDARQIALAGRLQPTDVELQPAELVALIGPNGGGKTSLLRALAGIERSRGTVRVDGEDLDKVAPARRALRLSFLPASRELVWPIAVRDVIALGLTSPEPRRVDELIALLELESLALRPTNALSTGERARVLLARALAPRPRLLLLDEPLSNLDPYWVLRTLSFLETTVREEQCAAIVSVHDLELASRFDRMLLADRGRITADASPAQVLAGAELPSAFRIERVESGWRISSRGDRRSLP